ncbi:MAG: hypothetical protein NUW09_02550 [Deltaproteobacteria bacterium]|nr:hypothetical protein [Deltaproteobacteria bacterium]
MAGRDSTIYDNYGSPFVITKGGVSVVGTAAAITALTATVLSIPFKCKLRGATRLSTTGGTAAGPTVLAQYSLAGTGTWTSIGTAAFGTNADGAASDFGVTETTLADGDQFRFAIAAGTAAATHTVNFVAEFIEVR